MLRPPAYNERPKKRNVWEYIAVIISILSISIAGYTVIQSNQAINESKQYYNTANNLAEYSLELQNITSNFEPTIIPYSISASVDNVFSNATLDSFGQFDDKGSLNVTLVVITPHASIVNFTDTAFNVTVRTAGGSDDFLSASNFFGTDMFIEPSLPYGFSGNMFSFYWPEAFVQPGVTEVNFTIPIVADIALNSNFTSSAFGGNLGTVTGQVTMFDVQTGKNVASFIFTTEVFVNINLGYR